MDLLLGFDPGGDKQFGWAVLERDLGGRPVVRAVGTAGHAAGAVDSALARSSATDRIVGAGIDSPLYWSATGERAADVAIRTAIKACGAPSPGGTVQHPNSLRGACVVQGPTAGLLLRRRFPALPITESHPKAMLWLLGLAQRGRGPARLTHEDIGSLVTCQPLACEHERDAVLAAIGAVGMIDKAPGWSDLVARETCPIFIIPGPVSYWLPLPAV